MSEDSRAQVGEEIFRALTNALVKLAKHSASHFDHSLKNVAGCCCCTSCCRASCAVRVVLCELLLPCELLPMLRPSLGGCRCNHHQSRTTQGVTRRGSVGTSNRLEMHIQILYAYEVGPCLDVQYTGLCRVPEQTRDVNVCDPFPRIRSEKRVSGPRLRFSAGTTT